MNDPHKLALIITCHPSERSLNWQIRNSIARRLVAEGMQVIHHDLYQEGFEPVLNLSDWQRHAAQLPAADDLDSYRRDISRAAKLVLVFPAWWYGMPAMLKGYFDRVLTPDFAYQIQDSKIRPAGLSMVVSFSSYVTYGSSSFWNRWIVGLPLKRTLNRGMRPLLARKCNISFNPIFGLDSSLERNRQNFLTRLGTANKSWQRFAD